MGPQRGQMEIITEGRDRKGRCMEGGKGWRKRKVWCELCVKQSGSKSKVYQSVSRYMVRSCQGERKRKRERIGQREDRGKDIKKPQRKGCGGMDIKLKSVLSQASQIASHPLETTDRMTYFLPVLYLSTTHTCTDKEAHTRAGRFCHLTKTSFKISEYSLMMRLFFMSLNIS